MTRRELLSGVVKGSAIALVANISPLIEGESLMAQESNKNPRPMTRRIK